MEVNMTKENKLFDIDTDIKIDKSIVRFEKGKYNDGLGIIQRKNKAKKEFQSNPYELPFDN